MEKKIHMRHFQRLFYRLHPFLLSSIAGALTIAQIVLVFLVHGSRSGVLEWAGWICLWTSSIFGIWPIIAFRNKGGVAKGQSYIKTTVLVDNGLYALVRHPGYLGGILFYLVTPLMLGSVWAFVPAALTVIATVARTSLEDQALQRELGGYIAYTQQTRHRLVPGIW